MSRRWSWLVLAGMAMLVALLLSEGKTPEPADRELPPLPYTDAPVRIAAFGTSLTHGGTWPDAAAAALSSCLGRPVEITRIARPGGDIRWAMAQIDRVTALKPDIILVEFAINDADVLDGLWLTASRDAHRTLIARLREDDPNRRIVLMTMNPVSGILRRLQRPRLAAYYRAQAELAATEDTGLLDFYSRWLSLPAGARNMPDGLHPGDATARTIVLPALVPYLGRLTGADCPSAG